MDSSRGALIRIAAKAMFSARSAHRVRSDQMKNETEQQRLERLDREAIRNYRAHKQMGKLKAYKIAAAQEDHEAAVASNKEPGCTSKDGS
jgi:hypothetical protein